MKARGALLLAAAVHLLSALHGTTIIARVWGAELAKFINDAEAVKYIGGTLLANVLLLLSTLLAAFLGGLSLKICLCLQVVFLAIVAATLDYETVAVASIPCLLVAFALRDQLKQQRRQRMGSDTI